MQTVKSTSAVTDNIRRIPYAAGISRRGSRRRNRERISRLRAYVTLGLDYDVEPRSPKKGLVQFG